MGPICQDPDAGTRMLGPVCADPDARTRMHGPVCKDPYARTHMLGPIYTGPCWLRTHMPRPISPRPIYPDPCNKIKMEKSWLENDCTPSTWSLWKWNFMIFLHSFHSWKIPQINFSLQNFSTTYFFKNIFSGFQFGQVVKLWQKNENQIQFGRIKTNLDLWFCSRH